MGHWEPADQTWILDAPFGTMLRGDRGEVLMILGPHSARGTFVAAVLAPEKVHGHRGPVWVPGIIVYPSAAWTYDIWEE